MAREFAKKLSEIATNSKPDAPLGVCIKVDGSIDVVSADDAEMRALIGEYPQYVPCTQDSLGQLQAGIWCDEYGVQNKKPFNATAVDLLGSQVFGGRLLGTVIVTLPDPSED